MTGFGISDLARQLSLQLSSTRLKSQTNRLSLELSSGKLQNPGARTSRDLTQVAALNRSLTLLGSLKTSIAETGIFVRAQQTALDNVQSQSESATSGFLAAGTARHPAHLAAVAVDAENRFASLISTLNTRAGDQSVFAGNATDGPALAPAEDILAALRADIAGESDAAGVAQRLSDWFMQPGGGFETMAYLGATDPAGPFPLGPGESASPEATAASQGIRQALLGFAMAAMITEPAVNGDVNEQAALATGAAETLMSNATAMTDLRAGVGILEARIDEATARTVNEQSTTEQALSALTSADPYRTATELQDVMQRLEALNTLTARISRLSLTEFLR